MFTDHSLKLSSSSSELGFNATPESSQYLTNNSSSMSSNPQINISKRLLSHASSKRNVWICAIALIVINFNIGITSYVVDILESEGTFSQGFIVWLYSSIILGVVAGQVFFGILSDSIGRSKSFKLSAILLVIGSATSVLAGLLTVSVIFSTSVQLSCTRFVLGFGAGGMFPIVATISRESSQRVQSIITTVQQ